MAWFVSWAVQKTLQHAHRFSLCRQVKLFIYLQEKAFQKFCELKLEHLKALEPVVSVVRESIQKYNSLVTIKDDEKLAKLSDIHLKCVEALAPETCGESIIHYNR